jgi:hypothetical protein
VLEQSQDIVTDNDTLLARQNVLDTHIDDCLVGLRKIVWSWVGWEFKKPYRKAKLRRKSR